MALPDVRAGGTHIVTQTLVREQLWYGSDGHFGGRPVDASTGATSDAIVHLAPQPRILGRLRHIRLAKLENTSASDESDKRLLHSCINAATRAHYWFDAVCALASIPDESVVIGG